MADFNSKMDRCSICKDDYTSINTEVAPGVKIYVCQDCLERAKNNFIWICINCGGVHMRPKKQVIDRTADFELKRAYMICEDQQIIQGIDICFHCDPEGILAYMDSVKVAMEC